eukprot:11431447-Heterocapsa_arctica.AAC.1
MPFLSPRSELPPERGGAIETRSGRRSGRHHRWGQSGGCELSLGRPRSTSLGLPARSRRSIQRR